MAAGRSVALVAHELREGIQANWQNLKLRARSRWGRITVGELDLIAGQRELLVAQIQAIYHVSREMAHLQVEWWQRRQREPGAARR